MHMLTSTVMTQLLSRTTSLISISENVRMTPRIYLRTVVPIGMAFSASIICSNHAYLYLNISFIQMLKVRCQTESRRSLELAHCNVRLPRQSLLSCFFGSLDWRTLIGTYCSASAASPWASLLPPMARSHSASLALDCKSRL